MHNDIELLEVVLCVVWEGGCLNNDVGLSEKEGSVVVEGSRRKKRKRGERKRKREEEDIAPRGC